jgi:hypothetical protein
MAVFIIFLKIKTPDVDNVKIEDEIKIVFQMLKLPIYLVI